MNEDVHASRRGKVVIAIALLLIWSAFVYFAYTYSKDYFDTSIKELDDKYYKSYQTTIKEVNELKDEISNLKRQINTLNGSINSFNENMNQIFDDVNSIDSVINDSSILQDATNQKLEELDARLIELIDSLEILKKAPNE